MAYLFATDEQRREMLATAGLSSVDELFASIPRELQLDAAMDLPPALTEWELESHVRQLAAQNASPGDQVCLMGGGAYDHFVPAVVDEIASRGEFYTAYTPYQAEASQGSLQAFFEFQTLVCRLTGLDVANASLYEGATAVSEAVFMAMRATGRTNRVVLLGSVHPEYRQVVETYTRHSETEVVTVPTRSGGARLDDVTSALNEETACLVIQHPNFFGCLEDVEALTAAAREVGAVSIVSFDPISVGVLKRPGDYGADVAVAEGQPLGIPLQFGGPYLGILSCREQFLRKMPGRLIGETVDRNGKRAYVLNLQTREQHIRREKATSNICTNQGLLALRAATYLSLVGPTGLQEAADLCCRKAHYLAERLQNIDGVELMFDRPFFKEFVIRVPGEARSVIRRLGEQGFGAGPVLADVDDALPADGVLLAVTEKRTRAELDRFVDALTEII